MELFFGVNLKIELSDVTLIILGKCVHKFNSIEIELIRNDQNIQLLILLTSIFLNLFIFFLSLHNRICTRLVYLFLSRSTFVL